MIHTLPLIGRRNPARLFIAHRTVYILLACWLALVVSLPLAAQEDTGLDYGAAFSGRLDNTNPRQVYYFDGLRGEVISIGLRVTDGNLDPVLTVLDNRGRLVTTMDDYGGNKVPSIPALTLPQTDRYYVVVGRFGYALGNTTGGFEVTIERVSVSSASGSQLRYGDNIINRISDMEPQLYYTFQAQAGDILTIGMRRVSGDLDPYLQVVQARSGNAFVIADNDDNVNSPASFDALIEGLVIEEDDTYVIIASRYGQSSGTSSGNFLLTLDTGANSGLGNSSLAPFPLQIGTPVEGTLTNSQYERFYRFTAQANDLISVQLERLGGGLDPFVILADADLQPITSDDDSGGGQNAQISQFVVPESGQYYVIATRFDREAGTSAGNYRLQVVSLGNAFDEVEDGVQRLGYGSTASGLINDETPERLYAFYGEAGDTITVSMNRADGNLDPLVSILDSEQRPLVTDDDSGGNQNARIAAYTLPASGTYYLRATRYSGDPPGDPNTSGNFILVLAQRVN